MPIKPCFDVLTDEEMKYLMGKQAIHLKSGLSEREASIKAVNEFKHETLNSLSDIYKKVGVPGYEGKGSEKTAEEKPTKITTPEDFEKELATTIGIKPEEKPTPPPPKELTPQEKEINDLQGSYDRIKADLLSQGIKPEEIESDPEMKRLQDRIDKLKSGDKETETQPAKKEPGVPGEVEQTPSGETEPGTQTPESGTDQPPVDSGAKEETSIGREVEAAFAGGRIKGKIIKDDRNKITIQADDGTKYPIKKSDILNKGETIQQHYDKSFEGKVDKLAEKAIETLGTPKHLRGVNKQGIGAEEVIKAAAEIIKAAHRAGKDIKEAIETAIDYLKARWDESWGEMAEADMRKQFSDLDRDEKIKDVIDRSELTEDQLRASIKKVTGLSDEKVNELIRAGKKIDEPKGEKTEDKKTSDSKYTKEVQDILNFADRKAEFTGNAHTDRKSIEGIRNSMVIHAENLIKALPKKFKDAALQENVYHHMEDSSIPLTPDEIEFRDQYIKPLQEALDKVYKKIINEQPDLAEGMDKTLKQIGYVPREVKDKRGPFERLAEGARNILGSKVKTTSGHLKSRVYQALTQQTPDMFGGQVGDRKVVVIKGREVFESTPEGLKKLGNYDGSGQFTDGSGNIYKVGDATVKEIESGTPTEYYKTPLANFLNAFVELKQVDMASDFVNNMKKEMQDEGMMFDVKKGPIPEDYATTDLPNFRGYAFPKKISAELNRLSYANKSDPLQALSIVNRFLRNAIVFGTGIPHWANEVDTWLKEGGVSRFSHPVRLIKSGMMAAHALIAQTPEYFQIMEQGGSLMSHDTKNYHKLLLDATMIQLKSKPGVLNAISKALGYSNPLKLMKVLADFSHKSAMASHDFLMLQAVFEHMDKGHNIREGIDYVNKYMPDYDIPSTVLGSENVSKLLRNPNITMFSAYHYGLFKSYGNMIKDFGKSAIGMDAKGLASAADKIAMTALLSAFVYPIIDKVADMIFTSKEDKKKGKKAQVRRPGSSKIIEDTYELATGQKSLAQYIYGYATPAQATNLSVELIENKQIGPYTRGEQIYTPSDITKHPGEAAKDIGEYAGGKINPVSQYEDIAAGKKTFKDVIEEQINIKHSKPDAEKEYEFLRYESSNIRAKAQKLKKSGDMKGAEKLWNQYLKDLDEAHTEAIKEKNKSK